MPSGQETATLKNTGENPDSGRQAPPQAEEACRIVSPTLAPANVGLSFHPERVCVYIDGSNFYYGLRSIKERYTDRRFDFERFVREITGRRLLVRVYYYNASLKKQIDERLYRMQQQFFATLRNLGFRVVLCRRQRRTAADGTEHYAIKGDDIHLAIDMLKDAYEDLYDTAILVSGDGDFAPLARYVGNRGKRIENYHFAGNVSRALAKSCDEARVIDRKAANRFFYRGERAEPIRPSASRNTALRRP